MTNYPKTNHSQSKPKKPKIRKCLESPLHTQIPAEVVKPAVKVFENTLDVQTPAV